MPDCPARSSSAPHLPSPSIAHRPVARIDLLKDRQSALFEAVREGGHQLLATDVDSGREAKSGVLKHGLESLRSNDLLSPTNESRSFEALHSPACGSQKNIYLCLGRFRHMSYG